MRHMCIDAVVCAAKDFGFTWAGVQDACATRDLEFNGKTIPLPSFTQPTSPH